MVNKIIGSGDRSYYTNGSGSSITAGALVVVGLECLARVENTIADGATSAITKSGIIKATKNTGLAFAVGDPVWYDLTNAYATNVATGNYFLGFAVKAAASAATTVEVNMQPFALAPGKVITGAAAEATTLTAGDFLTGVQELWVKVPNTTGVTLNLPSVATIPVDKRLRVRKTAAAAAAVTIDPAGSEQIAGGATYASIDANNDEAVFVNNGTAWELLSASLA